MADTSQIPVMIYCEPSRYAVGVIAGGKPSLVRLDLQPDATPEQVAERLVAVVGCGRRVVVALPSMACLVAAVRTDDLPRKNKRQAMLYRLEEHLPVAAEDLSADFLDRGDWALGIAVQAEAWSSLLEALEKAGLSVAAVCPMALLAVQSHQARQTPSSRDSCEKPDAFLWQDGERLEMFFLTGGGLDQWYVLPATAADVALVIHARASRSPGSFRIAAHVVDPQLLKQIAGLPGVEIIDPDPAMSPAALSTQAIAHAAIEWANTIVSGRRRPLVDLFRDGDLASGRGHSSSSKQIRGWVAAALCCLCVAGALFWRATRYSAAASRFDAEKRAIFQKVFPGQEPPVGITLRLQSVEQELRGGLPGELPGTHGPPVLALLHDTLAHLPAEVRCRWTEMRFDPGSLALDGEVLRHADAGVIAAALRRARSLESFVVEEPQTRQLEGGVVGFSISAAIPPAARVEGGTP